MGKLFSGDSAIGRALTKIGELVLLSILWFVMSLPIVTIGANTTALYYATVKSLRRSRGYPIREYWSAWKQNFFKSTVLTVILFAIVLLLASYVMQLGLNLNDIVERGVQSVYADSSEQTVGLYVICGAALLIVAVLFIYSFPILSRFHIGVGHVVAMAFVMAVRYFYYSIALLVVAGALVYMVMRLPLGIMFAPGLWALLSSYLIEKAMKKYLPEPSEDEDAWWVDL